MRTMTTLAVLAAAAFAATAASAAPVLKIKDAVARVVVIPENRSDVKVEFLTTNASLPLDIRKNGDETVIDGDLRHKINNCNSRNGKVWVKVRGVGEVAYDNFPQIAVRVPMNVRVEAGGAVFGDIGRSDEVKLSNAGCGDWTVANTRGKLEISQAGSGDTKAGAAGALEISIAGSGDVSAQAVAGSLEVNIAGSGDVTVASVNGSIEGNIAGSGDISVGGGHASNIEINVMGSGDVSFNGVAESADISLAGAGDVRITKVNGSVKKHIAGSGNVSIGGQ
jgi:hypothetical protein